MRFRYVEPNTPDGRARVALEARFDQFWSAIRDGADDLAAMLKTRGPIADWIQTRLPLIDAGVEWEFGPDETGGRKLVVTAAGNRGLRPAVDRLIELAPTLPGWTFVGYRQPEPASVAPMLLEGRGGPHARPIENPTFRVTDAPHGLIGIECFATNATAEPIMRAFATILTEILVGEFVYDAWIGPIDLTSTPRRGLMRRAAPPADAVAPDALRGVTDRMIAERVARLPDRPRSELTPAELAAWNDGNTPGTVTGFQVAPQPSDAGDDDWAGQNDVIYATTPEVPLFQAIHAPGFDSRRFSRVGERFAYLKIEHVDVWPRSELIAHRGALEDALDPTLRDARVGCVHGSASGQRYAYVELPLADVDAAIPLIRDAARDAGVGDRSWLLFHDADLVDEWVGLTTNSPPPPRRRADGDA